MKLTVIGSDSHGNGYIFHNEKEALIVELGCKISKYQEALNFNLSKVVASIASHVHGDHFGHAKEFLDKAINVYTNQETIDKSGIKHHRLKAIPPRKLQQFGSFKVYPFDVEHDVRTYGFIIEHPEMGRTLFVTDTFRLKYRFEGLNNILIEANYSDDIIDNKDMGFLRSRVIESHMEFGTTKKILRNHNLSKVNNIVLIHLSNGNSNAQQFMNEVRNVTGKNNVFVAENNMNINFNLKPF